MMEPSCRHEGSSHDASDLMHLKLKSLLLFILLNVHISKHDTPHIILLAPLDQFFSIFCGVSPYKAQKKIRTYRYQK